MLTTELGRPLAACNRRNSNAPPTCMDVYAEEGLRIHAEMPLTGTSGEKVIVTREPVGVVIAITPFNYPVTLLSFKLGAALIAGCTVVAKPAEDTPLSTLMLAQLVSRSGLSARLLQRRDRQGPRHRHGDDRASDSAQGRLHRRHHGRQERSRRRRAGTMKRVTLELGGQCPAIVCADADIDSAAAAIARHAFANSGQFCYRVNRVYVERPVYEAFLEVLVQHAEKLDVGDGLTSACALGPLVNEKIYRNSERHVADARNKGARIADRRRTAARRHL